MIAFGRSIHIPTPFRISRRTKAQIFRRARLTRIKRGFIPLWTKGCSEVSCSEDLSLMAVEFEPSFALQTLNTNSLLVPPGITPCVQQRAKHIVIMFNGTR